MCIFIIIRYKYRTDTSTGLTWRDQQVLRLFNILCSFIFNTFNNSNNNEYWNDFPVFIMIKMCVCEIFIGEIFFFPSTTTTDAIRSIHRKTFTFEKIKTNSPTMKTRAGSNYFAKRFYKTHTSVWYIFVCYLKNLLNVYFYTHMSCRMS